MGLVFPLWSAFRSRVAYVQIEDLIFLLLDNLVPIVTSDGRMYYSL